jgi:hypothetical protein
MPVLSICNRQIIKRGVYMKTKDLCRFLSLILIICVAGISPVFAQEKSDEPKKSEESKKVEDPYDPDDSKYALDNYIDRFYSREVCEKLMNANLDRIYMLKVLVTNFKDKGWKGDYDKIIEDYKNGVALYYKRKMIKSRSILEANKMDINKMFKKASDDFSKDVQKMLDICANTIMIISLNKNVRYDNEKYRQLMSNIGKLRLGYSYSDQAMESYSNQHYMFSMLHYRSAKGYAIGIMEDLLKDDGVKKEDMEPEDYDRIQKLVSQKKEYNLPLLKTDNLNRIYVSGKESSKSESSKAE